jgi:hypothetical protein
LSQSNNASSLDFTPKSLSLTPKGNLRVFEGFPFIIKGNLFTHEGTFSPQNSVLNKDVTRLSGEHKHFDGRKDCKEIFNMKNKRFLCFGRTLIIGMAFGLVLAGCPTGNDPIGNDPAGNDRPAVAVVSIAAIPGVPVPATGGIPATGITPTAQYTGTVAWEGSPETFVDDTVYTATITLTAKEGYTLDGVKQDFFTVEGADSTTNPPNTGTVTAVFPQTAPTGKLAAALSAELNAIASGSATVEGATVTLTDTISIGSASGLTVPAGVTLDVTADNAVLKLETGAALTVNGTVISKDQRVRLEDSAGERTINGSGTIRLRGQGHLLKVVGGSTNKKLTLDGVTLVGVANNNRSLVDVRNGGSGTGHFVMKSGAITGNININGESAFGGGVLVDDGGTFTMEGGTISGNTAESTSSNSDNGAEGGGVFVAHGTFTMEGGTISGNTVKSSVGYSVGGGVRVGENSEFTMQGGAISGNKAEGGGWSDGGGVGVWNGTFTMEDGAISGNTVKSHDGGGGGVSVSENSEFTMEDGAISGNTVNNVSYCSGGGVRVSADGEFIMQGGTISGNKAEGGGWSEGGGVNVSEDGKFTMQGGTIYGATGNNLANSAGDSGAALYVDTNAISAKWGDGSSIVPLGDGTNDTLIASP